MGRLDGFGLYSPPDLELVVRAGALVRRGEGARG
jgi:hypothetical protein